LIVSSLYIDLTFPFSFSYFGDFSKPEFAKAGAIPEETIVIPVGELPFPISMLDELRKLGMIVEVDHGKTMLREPMTVASAGEPLTPEQARILVKLDRPIIAFTINLLCKWEDGQFEEL
jgi:mRNA turnover protein 4